LDYTYTEPMSIEELATELKKDGDESFRQKYAHAFLIVKNYPQSLSELVSPKTVRTSVIDLPPPSGKPGARPEAQRIPDTAIALNKSNRNFYTAKITVGRAKNNDIIIRASKVSKLHAAFIQEADGGYSVIDMDSTNGTWLNGSRIPKNQPVRLKNGDQIAFCHHEFEFLSQDMFLEVLKMLF
jgi:hypothetical protein